jgi:hypothetical protein
VTDSTIWHSCGECDEGAGEEVGVAAVVDWTDVTSEVMSADFADAPASVHCPKGATLTGCALFRFFGELRGCADQWRSLLGLQQAWWKGCLGAGSLRFD